MIAKCNPDKQKILVPIILYMDSVVTDTNDRLGVTPLNITLGIFNTLTRRQPEAHTTKYFHLDDKAEASLHKKKTQAIDKGENLHRALSKALEDMALIMKKDIGIAWNLP